MRLFSAARGIALILVLWILVLLTVIAISFAQTIRTDVNIVANGGARVKAQALADAAIARALIDQFKPANLDGRWNADGATREWVYREGKVNVTVLDEAGKIDINTGNEQLLRGLFLAQGLTDDEANRMVDVIGDWKDIDERKRPRGAEFPDYEAAGMPYGPANSSFQGIEELKLVLGMTPELYARIAPSITVYSRQPGINEQIASREVLRAIPGASDEQIDAYIAARDTARANKQPLPTFAANRFRSFSSGQVTRIRADAETPDGGRYSREVVVRRTNDPRRPFAYLSKKETRELPPDPLQPAVTTDTSGNTTSRVMGTLGR